MLGAATLEVPAEIDQGQLDTILEGMGKTEIIVNGTVTTKDLFTSATTRGIGADPKKGVEDAIKENGGTETIPQLQQQGLLIVVVIGAFIGFFIWLLMRKR